MSTFPMLLKVDELPVTCYHTVIVPTKSSLKNNISTNNDENSVDRFRRPSSLYSQIRSGAPIVIYFGPQNSTLRTALVLHLTAEDITLIAFSMENLLWQWMDQNSSLIVACLVLQPTVRSQEMIAHSHTYASVRSVLVRCRTADLPTIQRLSRSYAKLDGTFDDDTRILIKLVADLTLFSEELGDQQREDENNEIEAQRNYDRALQLCILVQKF